MHTRFLKQFFLLLLSVSLVLTLSACGSGDKEEEKEAVTVHPVSVGETVKKPDGIELTIDAVGTADRILPSAPGWVMIDNAPDLENETYFFISGTMKNLSGDTYSIGAVYSNFLFDGKYNYEGTIRHDTGDMLFFGPIKPLETIPYYIYVSVPDELVGMYASFKIQLGFHNNFKTDMKPSFERFENQYESKRLKVGVLYR